MKTMLSAFMVMLVLVGTLTFSLNIQPVKVAAPMSTAATIESCTASEPKDFFSLEESVYLLGNGFATLTDYSLYVVEDIDDWVGGKPIPSRVPGTSATITSDATGAIPVTLVWNAPLTIGDFDIVVDVDGDGMYTQGVDALDTGDGGTAGFVVIDVNGNPPNTPTGIDQYRSDGATVIPEGGTTPESTVVFRGTVSDPDGDDVQLEIELRQMSEAFTDEPTPETLPHASPLAGHRGIPQDQRPHVGQRVPRPQGPAEHPSLHPHRTRPLPQRST